MIAIIVRGRGNPEARRLHRLRLALTSSVENRDGRRSGVGQDILKRRQIYQGGIHASPIVALIPCFPMELAGCIK